MLDVGTLWSVRVEDLLQDLPQEGTIGGLQDKKQREMFRRHRGRKIETCSWKRDGRAAGGSSSWPRLVYGMDVGVRDDRVINLPLAGESLQKEQRKRLQG